MEVTLKTTGWYNKLQKWTLGKNKPNLFSLCPYFWLTIFCIVISPFTLIYKCFNYIFNNINNYFDKQYESWLLNMNIEDIVELRENYKFKNKPFTLRKISASRSYYNWVDLQLTKMSYDELHELYDLSYNTWLEKKNKENEAYYNQRNKEIKKEEEKEILKEIRRKKFKNIWIPIVTWTQRIFNFIFTLFMFFIITICINYLIINFSTSFITLKEFKIVAFTLLFIITLITIVYLFILYVNWCKDNNRVPLILRPLIYIGRYIGTFFIYIFNKLSFIVIFFKGIFGLFWQYFKANKNDYCPAINWEENKENE